MDSSVTWQFRMLGPLEVQLGDDVLTIATRRQRALLLLLLLNVGRVVPTERLIDQLWDGGPPPQAAVTLRSYVSNLRRALGGHDGAATALVTRGPGYSLEVPPDSIDAEQLRRYAEQGRGHLRSGRAQQALDSFDAAVALWSGDPLAEVADHAAVQGVITELTETWLGAVEGRFEALLATGRHADAIAGLESFVRDHPLREEPRALLMLALHRAGRTPDALEVHRSFRDLLRDELGIDPSPRLERLHQQVLEQDPGLAAPSVALERSPETGPDATRDVTVSPQGRRLVGRSRETAVLRRHLDALVSGAGSLVLLGGEPGIGKSTLLAVMEEEARRRGVTVHRGRAPGTSGAPAFWTWSQVLDSIAGDLDDEALRSATAGAARPVAELSPGIAERLGHTYAVTGDSPQQMRFLLYEAVSTFLERAGADQPALVTLDDIHWADVPSLELLSYLTPTLGARPLMVVAAYRDLPADRTTALSATLATVSREDAVEELDLAGLTRQDVGALLAEVADGVDADRDRLVGEVHERTGGNPFFVRQLTRLLEETAGEQPGWTSQVPPGVSHVLTRRLLVLPAGVEGFLSAAAVVGREFDVRLVARIAELHPDAALVAYDVAATHGLVEAPAGAHGRPRFVHALVQEVVLSRLPLGRAARLHARAAEHLAGLPGVSPDELAEHWWAAREVTGAEGVPAHLAAAQAAARLFAHERAETHLQRALHLVRTADPPDPAAEVSVLLALFQLIATARGWGDEDARSLIDRAMELAGPAGCTDDNVRLWWSVFFFLIDRDDESAYVPVARTLLASLDRNAGDATRAAVHLMNIFTALADDDGETALDHLRRARTHVEAAPNRDLALFDEHLHVMLLLIEGYWTALTGDAEGHHEAVLGAVALADADGRPFPRAVARTLGAASAVYVEDDPAFALDLAGQALELDRRFGFEWLEMLAATVRTWAEAHLGRPDPDAVAALAERLDEVGSHGHQGTESVLLLLMADLHALGGRPDRATELLRRVRTAPGPYQGLTVELVDRRLTALDAG